MSTQTYLIDTNVIIGLEDDHTVQPSFAQLTYLASKHKIEILVHEAAKDDIARDRDRRRQQIALSKLKKFQTLGRVRGLTSLDLENEFGSLPKPNDVVDATLLHALQIGAADFLVTQDRRLHDRARRHSAELGRRVLFVADAVQLLTTTYDPVELPIRYIEEAAANTIALSDLIFESLREDYDGFDTWWREKCVRERRTCWIVDDSGLAGLIVIKDEQGSSTDATQKVPKILKLCTFKVRPEKRGSKLGELLLKKAFWYSQANKYDLIYVTTFEGQTTLIDLLEYYGFVHTRTKLDGELIYEKTLSQERLEREDGISLFDTDRLNYPRFVGRAGVRAFGVPIREGYHDTLYPDLVRKPQGDLFEAIGLEGGPRRPGNTIRKVYLCRAPSGLGEPGSLLFFYKGKSDHPPSQSLTAIGIFEECSIAHSLRDLMQLTGGRSVYSETQLTAWQAAPERPVKVINYLLAGYIEPAISIDELKGLGIIGDHPPQSIFEIRGAALESLLGKIEVDFDL